MSALLRTRKSAPGGGVGQNLILGGDIEEQAERQLLRGAALRSVDVAIVPHHGSRTSSSSGLIAALTPVVAVVSAGFGNRWGLPRSDVVDRWESAGAQVVSTTDSGAIHGRICSGTGLQSIRRFRVEHARLWHE